MPEPIIGPRNISHSQLSHPCGLQLRFHRERIPWPNRSISLLYGGALHSGLEEWWLTRDLAKAIKAADHGLNAELLKDPPVLWDIKRGPAQRAAIPDLMTAQSMLRKHLTAWATRYEGWQGQVLSIEKNVWVNLTKFTPAWKLQCRLDAVVEEDGKKIILDYKSAGKSWTPEKLEGHKAQAYLYLGAEFYDTHVAPDFFSFLVFLKGTDKVEEYRFPFDAKSVNRYLENVVRPTILSIEAGSYIPNTETWQHDERYCSWWNHCPLGAAAQK